MSHSRYNPPPPAFMDTEAIDSLGCAAFCVFVRPDCTKLVGGLLVINARGEPLEYLYGWVEVTDTADYIVDTAERNLVRALLAACAGRTRLAFISSRECIYYSETLAYPPAWAALNGCAEPILRTEPVLSGEPPTQSTLKLLHELETRHLLSEPFERTMAGLKIIMNEAYTAFSDSPSSLSGPGLAVGAEESTTEAVRIAFASAAGKDESIVPVHDPVLQDDLARVLWPSADSMLAGVLTPWHKPLFAYQIDGIKALISRDALLLADDMGLGKTIQAISALRILFICRSIKCALLVVPAGLIPQWRKEMRQWAPELRISVVNGNASDRSWLWTAPAHIYLTGYETLRSDCTANTQSPPRRRIWDVIMLDEAQKIKNRDIELSRKCKILYRKRAWALSGTPLENQEDDLASVMEFIAPLDINKSGLRLSPGLELRKRHRQHQLRRKKMDVLPQLPPKIISEVSLIMDGEQRAFYDRVEKEGIIQLKQDGEEANISGVLELILRLKQICNFHPVSGKSVKAEDMTERLDTLVGEGHRALVFSQFTDGVFGVRAIEKRLSAYSPLIYTGDMPLQERERVVALFKHDASHKVLILSLRAGGQGLNLQDASYVFHFDRWWNPAVEHQAEDRAHRLGQVMSVTVYNYLIESTIEERIDSILREKQLLFDDLVDHVSIDIASRLTADELFGLFGLAAPKKKPR